jgi:hypothetical protein
MAFPKVRMVKLDFQRKHIVIGLAVLTLLAFAYRFYPFFEEMVSPGKEIELKERRLIKYQKMIDSGGNIDKQRDSLNNTLTKLESRLLTGKTPSLAAVEVQKIVEEIAGKSAVQIGLVNVLKPEELDKHYYLCISVEFHIFPTMRQLKEILYRIETTQKYLDVKKMVVQEHGNRTRQRRCSITVTGLMKRPES